jgi:hypothetical protein
MTNFAPHRETVEFFVDCMRGGADESALSGILAEDVVLYSPLGGRRDGLHPARRRRQDP